MQNAKTSLARMSAAEASEQALNHAVEFARERGRIQAIADLMTERTGDSVTRQMVSRWLNPDPDKRQQPSLGNGLLLLWCVDVLEHDNGHRTTVDIALKLAAAKPKPRRRK